MYSESAVAFNSVSYYLRDVQEEDKVLDKLYTVITVYWLKRIYQVKGWGTLQQIICFRVTTETKYGIKQR